MGGPNADVPLYLLQQALAGRHDGRGSGRRFVVTMFRQNAGGNESLLGLCSRRQLTRTSVTVAGLERALRDLPWLQTLGTVPDLGRALAAAVLAEAEDGERHAEAGGKERAELRLKSYKSDRPPPLAVVAEHCPHLDEVAVRLAEGGDHRTSSGKDRR